MDTIIKYSTILLLILFVGCATSRPLNTPSGKPEILIENTIKKTVTDALVNEMLSQGFTIRNVTDYTVVFSKPLDSFTAQLLFGSRYDSTPEHRPSFMIVESDRGVRIVLTNQIITNPGSAFERVTDAGTGEAGQSWQDFLIGFSNLFKGRVGVYLEEDGTVLDIADDSPAMVGGILKGDKIISVDGKPFSDVNQLVGLLIGEPNTEVTVTILRSGNEYNITLIRKILQ